MFGSNDNNDSQDQQGGQGGQGILTTQNSLKHTLIFIQGADMETTAAAAEWEEEIVTNLADTEEETAINLLVDTGDPTTTQEIKAEANLADMEEEVALHMWEHPHKESLTQGRTLICPYTIKTILRL